jgi:hypothetical protein
VATADREFLLQQAARFRRLAREVTDERANLALEELALEYEAEAERIRLRIVAKGDDCERRRTIRF